MSWHDALGILHYGRQPGCPNKVPRLRSGDRFGHWEVLGRATFNQYLCRCDCGNRRKVYTVHLLHGRSKSCGCGRPNSDDHYKYAGFGEITGSYWNQIKRGSTRVKGRTYEVEFNLTIEYAWRLFLRQKRRCALSGLDLTMSQRRAEHTASLDRIDSRKGYVRGNVQWVHKDINRMKNTLSQSRFVELCRAVAAAR